MRTLVGLIACYVAFSSNIAHASNDAWEQCTVVEDLVILGNDSQYAAQIQTLRRSLNSSNLELVDKSNVEKDFSSQALVTCLARIDSKLSHDRISACRTSLTLLRPAYLMRVNGHPKSIAASLNVSSAPLIDEMINFIYAKEMPSPGKALLRTWQTEWLYSCAHSK
ncbi:hypothetical protein [Rhodoferax saidenbachensis]|uniref:hypothetical protein n=1 Tax=Rhodoferax saidenbachensis TaxID=1484693 RepID=UPI00126820A4|nr:hypothetical protein [Rhodoferax saidenbachensis]